MDFDPDLSSKIVASLLGGVFGSCLTACWTNKRNQKDLCLKVYERWTSTSLSQSRKKAFKPLQIFFEPIFLEPDKWSNKLVKLSELQSLSKPSYNYKPREYWSEDFINDFLQVTTFLCDLNKLMKEKLVDVRLSRIIFRDTVLPWYKYFDKLEFDLSNEMDSEHLKSEISSLYTLIK
jgi:hypothetical protein